MIDFFKKNMGIISRGVILSLIVLGLSGCIVDHHHHRPAPPPRTVVVHKPAPRTVVVHKPAPRVIVHKPAPRVVVHKPAPRRPAARKAAPPRNHHRRTVQPHRGPGPHR